MTIYLDSLDSFYSINHSEAKQKTTPKKDNDEDDDKDKSDKDSTNSLKKKLDKISDNVKDKID